MIYEVSAKDGWVVLRLSGRAENNEPLQAKRRLFPRLLRTQVRIVVDIGGLEELGVWEMGLLNSLRKEVDLRGGTLRLCNLDPSLGGYFQGDRFAQTFPVYADVASATATEEDNDDIR